MLDNKAKADVLRATATSIKQGIYNWYYLKSCNCGHLLKVLELILGVEITDLAYDTVNKLSKNNSLWDDDLSYSALFNYYEENTCQVTNLPFTEVLDRIILMGFSLQELKDLEYCSDPTILERMERYISINEFSFGNKDYVITYLNTWAALLEEQEELPQVERVTNSTKEKELVGV